MEKKIYNSWKEKAADFLIGFIAIPAAIALIAFLLKITMDWYFAFWNKIMVIAVIAIVMIVIDALILVYAGKRRAFIATGLAAASGIIGTIGIPILLIMGACGLLLPH